MTGSASPHTVPTGARACSVLAFALAVIAAFFYPIFFGPAAIILGAAAMAVGDKALSNGRSRPVCSAR